MTTIRISGASDDLVEISGRHPICDEYAPDGDGRFVASIDGGGLDAAWLVVQYLDPGVWLVGLAPWDEGYEIPAAWNARYVRPLASEPDYTAVLELDIPDSVVLTVKTGTDHR